MLDFRAFFFFLFRNLSKCEHFQSERVGGGQANYLKSVTAGVSYEGLWKLLLVARVLAGL